VSARKGVYMDLATDVVALIKERAKTLGCSQARYVSDAVRKEALGEKEKKRGPKTALDDDKNLDRLLDEALKTAFVEDPALIKELDKKTLATLIAQRSPKPKQENEELDATFLSLTNALKGLPDVEDVDAEVRRTKTKLDAMKLKERALELQIASLRKSGTKELRQVFAEEKEGFLREVKEFMLDQRARGLDWHACLDDFDPRSLLG